MDAEYQTLARAVMEACPADFTSGEIVGTMREDYGDIVYNCTVDGEERRGLPSDSATDFEVYRSLKKIRTAMAGQGPTPWTSCTFRIKSDGTFKFDVEYED